MTKAIFGFFCGLRILIGAGGAQALSGIEAVEKLGTSNCVRPGTVLEFMFNGRSGARVVNAKADIPVLAKAAERKLWFAGTMTEKRERMMIIDNLDEARIIFRIRDGRGVIFVRSDDNEACHGDVVCAVQFR